MWALNGEEAEGEEIWSATEQVPLEEVPLNAMKGKGVAWAKAVREEGTHEGVSQWVAWAGVKQDVEE